MNSWRPSTWGDEISLEYGKAIRGYESARGSVRVFGSNGPIGWTEKPLAKGPGVILGRKGAYRGVQYSEDEFFVIDTAYYVVPKTDLDMRWLYYAIQYHKLGEIDDGSPIPSTTRAAVYVRELDVPPKDVQKEIARVLGAIDDKIDLNRRINQTLEAMAQAIFKSWFVDFDPVKAKIAAIEQGQDLLRAAMRAISGKTDAELDQMPREHHDQLAATAALFPDEMQESELGEIPMGWKAGTLTEICQLNPESWSAKTLPGAVRYVDLANTKGGEITGVQNIGGKEIPSRARRILRYGDTIVGTVRPGNRSFALVGEAGLTGSTGFAALRPKVSHWLEFVYLVATSETNIKRLAHLADGGAYPAVRPEMVVQEDVVLPTQLVAQAFNQNVQPLFSQILANRKSAILLAELRDTLLPKLLSGDVSVETLTDEVEQ
ncbi:restriction endonuclease subunit S [Pseudomonas aeruginosa]|uniref:restriction endonuclease subunit S n=1 Tax=Pseudomonas aeruginosa TaxID=287 RepID=UPI00233F84D8|nr:restriction endonuclease subunit S [Pseudomonas aeruginosa]MDC3903683.1 restriction endonuclease subunit S [Pseudomonas aeruginosa]HBP1855010.1 restriction endonuclease subunit S [Pseudomonas aeruginosa]